MKEERKNNIIDTPEKFKNKYIDLSNTELNGEMTEEATKELGFAMEKCFVKDYCNNNIVVSVENNAFSNRKIIYIKPDDSRFEDIRCGLPEEQEISRAEAKDEYPDQEYVLDNYQEISVHDILGYDDKVSVTEIKRGKPDVTVPMEQVQSVIIDLKKESITITKDNFQPIKEFLENESKYKEGSRMWAVEQAFNGEEVRHEDWSNPKARIGWSCSGFELTSGWFKDFPSKYTWKDDVQKDGWELYKEEEPKKIMTFREHIKERKSFKWNGHGIHESIIPMLEDIMYYFDNEIIED